jgi:hypothetical protein
MSRLFAFVMVVLTAVTAFMTGLIVSERTHRPQETARSQSEPAPVVVVEPTPGNRPS